MENTFKRIEEMIENPVMLFMKGTPQFLNVDFLPVRWLFSMNWALNMDHLTCWKTAKSARASNNLAIANHPTALHQKNWSVEVI